MIDAILGKKITNIYTVGFIDINNGIGEYYPDLRWIYIEFDNLLLEFESFAQYSRLKISEVEEVRYPFALDEDMVKAKSSIIENVLVSSYLRGNVVTNVDFIDFEEGSEQLECKAAKIFLKNSQVIFLDPTFPYGIGIGGQDQESYWQHSQNLTT